MHRFLHGLEGCVEKLGMVARADDAKIEGFETVLNVDIVWKFLALPLRRVGSNRSDSACSGERCTIKIVDNVRGIPHADRLER